MEIGKFLKGQFGDNIVTLSGEILVTPKLASDKEAVAGFDRSMAEKVIGKIKNEFGFLQIDVAVGLVDVTIKFFANKKRGAEEKFLEKFNEHLGELIKVILENEKLTARVNVFGTFETLKYVKEYRYLNKKEDVRFAITNEKANGASAWYLRPVVSFVGLIIVLCGYFGYVGYQHFFAQKEESKVEEKVEQKTDKNLEIKPQETTDKKVVKK